MLTRLLTAAAIVSLVAALAVAVLWFRAGHGHSDVFHLGASSPTQTSFMTGPPGFAVEESKRTGSGIQSRMRFYDFRSVFGTCLVVPGLWTAVQVRRRLLPRRPDLQPHAVPRRRRRVG